MSTTERFGFKAADGKPSGPEAERRLHLVALDYWHDLCAGRPMPDFRQLTPQGLSPFRGESLLLDFSEIEDESADQAAHIRFVGDTLSSVLMDQVADTGAADDASLSTAALAATDFGRELLAHLRAEDVRQKPQEFEYEDDLIGGRGILMPLSLGDSPGSFIWIVATFDFIAYRAQQAQSDATEIFANQLANARTAWEETPPLGAGARSALYKTLQSAYLLYEQAEADPVAWKKLLSNSGLRQQSRAPFTPALKLVFGKDHDKTRLTEYASALAHARRHGVAAADFIPWIDAFPGGIKGCVEQERAKKRAEGDEKQGVTPLGFDTAPSLGSLALTTSSGLADQQSGSAQLLVAYVRQTQNGGEVIALAPASKQDESKVRTLINKTQNNKTARTT